MKVLFYERRLQKEVQMEQLLQGEFLPVESNQASNDESDPLYDSDGVTELTSRDLVALGAEEDVTRELDRAMGGEVTLVGVPFLSDAGD